MAVTVDSEESGAAGHKTNTSPLTWSFTNTAGNYLVVAVNASQVNGAAGNNNPTIDSVTYNSVAMTSLGTALDYGSKTRLQLFGLASPATGSNTVSVSCTFTGGVGTADRSICAGAISFSGVDTSTSSANYNSGSDVTGTLSSFSINVSSTTSGNYVASIGSTGTSATISATSPTVLTWNDPSPSSHFYGGNAAGGKQSTSGGTVAVGFSTSTADVWGIVGVEILASAGGGVTNHFLLLQGVGV